MRVTGPKSTPDMISADFDSLLARGTILSQTLSGDIWTDFNEHDPGVTMLEALCYALTDLGYRCSHPMEDLLASSSATTGVSVDEQPLFTGNEILVTAPVTMADIRAVILCAVPEIIDLILFERGDRPNCYQVKLAVASGSDPVQTRARARAILTAQRPLGVNFGKIEVVGSDEPQIQSTSDVLSLGRRDQDDTSMLSEHQIRENALRVDGINKQLNAGVSPTEIFNGPVPGAVTPSEAKQHNFAQAAKVTGLSHPFSLALAATSTQRPSAEMAAALETVSAADEARKAELRYGVNQLRAKHYSQLPAGDPNRDLARYRSVQHLFPQIYGLGAMGPDRGGAKRLAEVRQLKGYLVFAEQILANYLEQLNNVARLFSFSNVERSYFSQPLAHEPARPDDAPLIAPIFGALKDPDWLETYNTGLRKIVLDNDPYRIRLRRALDHLLARFGEEFETNAINRWMRREDHKTLEQVEDMQLGLRRDFLREIVDLGRDRGLGPKVVDPTKTALQRRVDLKCGADFRSVIIEHALLDPPPDPPRQFQALLLSAHGYQGVIVLNKRVPSGAWTATRQAVTDGLADPGAFRVSPNGGYSARLTLRTTRGELVFATPFPSFARARSAIKSLTAGPVSMTPSYLLAEGNAHRLSIVAHIPPQGAGPSAQTLFGKILAENLPAHLDAALYWVERAEYETILTRYRAALGPSAASGALIDRLDQLACKALLDGMTSP
ncbi:hypothetical protein [uncultured Ruegeria sp.]|uniref:hypothetical protein n=1 Tax=uncultured Ruegeria sp. TaxID=259304 RepID=UPI002627F979|nr:hypothetical protein [uncultured Ruegeria sp.]